MASVCSPLTLHNKVSDNVVWTANISSSVSQISTTLEYISPSLLHHIASLAAALREDN